MTSGNQSLSSLIKYSTPMLVSVGTQKKLLPSLNHQKEAIRTEDLLNSIIPPKEIVLENGQSWVQMVIPTPATRSEVIALTEELDRRLKADNIKPTGLCPIREQLYSDCFDELIRQLTIDTKQRGLLLVQVRDELRQQFQEYRKLYESSIAFGIRKMTTSESQRTNMQTQIMKLERENSELKQSNTELECKISETRKSNESWKIKTKEDHLEDVRKIKVYMQEIRDELDRILAGKGK